MLRFYLIVVVGFKYEYMQWEGEGILTSVILMQKLSSLGYILPLSHLIFHEYYS